MRQLLALAAAVSLLALSGCASTTTARAPNPNDPAEEFNRAMFAVNDALDTALIRPAAVVYDEAAPLPVKAATGNFFGNLRDLWTAANNLMQGNVGDAFSDVGRFLVNTTVGIGGAFDIASEVGLEKHEEDFGQTMGVWGVDEGIYHYWPIFGPRTTRDTAGLIVDGFADPVWYYDGVAVRNSLIVYRFIDVRARLLPLDRIVDEAALDRYSYIRDSYLQLRRRNVYNEDTDPMPVAPGTDVNTVPSSSHAPSAAPSTGGPAGEDGKDKP